MPCPQESSLNQTAEIRSAKSGSPRKPGLLTEASYLTIQAFLAYFLQVNVHQPMPDSCKIRAFPHQLASEWLLGIRCHS